AVRHARVATPSTCTVHAPHCPSPQPNLVPVRPKVSRSTHSSGMSGLTSTSRFVPLTSKVTMKTPSEPRELKLALYALKGCALRVEEHALYIVKIVERGL